MSIDIDEMKLIFSMDTDTNVYIYGCLLTADKVDYVSFFFFFFSCCFICLFVFSTKLYWYNLLIHVVSMIIVRSV